MNPRTPYILSALVAAAACHTAVPDLIPTPVAFERLPTQRLNITYPGWALISTRRRWLRLWEYYGPTDIDSLGHQAVPQVPEVDFERYQVFAYSLGIADGCRWTGELIARIVSSITTES